MTTPNRKITDSSLKIRRMDFEKRRRGKYACRQGKVNSFSIAIGLGTAKNGCFRSERFRLADERDRVEGEKAAGRSSQAAPAHRPRRQKLHRWEFSVM